MTFNPGASEVAWHLDFDTAHSASPEPESEAPPTQLDALFEIQGLLGTGGMGVVYRARHRRLERLVALKLLKGTKEGRPRFRLEAEGRAAARLLHPGIVQLLGAGVAGDQAYLVFELVEGGRSLDQVMRESPLGVRLELVAQVAEALGAAHAVGIVHRDVKGENVLVDASGRARLLDFGIALAEDEVRLTRTGELLGTPYYMAPERFRGRDLGPPADVWSLGVLLYQALTGEFPYHADTLMALIGALNQPPVPPRERGDGVPRAVEAVCLRCLAAEPRSRYADAAEVAHALRRAVAPAARESGARALQAAAVLGLLTCGVGAITLWPQSAPPTAPKDVSAEVAHLLTAALQAKAGGDLNEALSTLDQLLALAPDHPEALARRGSVKLALGRAREALDDLDRALNLDAALLPAYSKRGEAREVLGRHLEAVDDYSAALHLDPLDAELHAMRALANLRGGVFDAALVDANQALRRDPQLRPALAARGFALVRLGRHQEALVVFDRYLAAEPDGNVLLARGELYTELGQFEQAVADYGRALELDPSLVAGYLNRGIALLHLGRYEESLPDFDQALALDPTNPIGRMSRGDALYGLGRYEEAITECTGGLELSPNHPSGLACRGRSHYALGHYAEACADFRSALARGLAPSQAAEARAWLKQASAHLPKQR